MVSPYETWGDRPEALRDPDQSLYRWYAETDKEQTTIYANFHGADPNGELTEINVRRGKPWKGDFHRKRRFYKMA